MEMHGFFPQMSQTQSRGTVKVTPKQRGDPLPVCSQVLRTHGAMAASGQPNHGGGEFGFTAPLQERPQLQKKVCEGHRIRFCLSCEWLLESNPCPPASGKVVPTKGLAASQRLGHLQEPTEFECWGSESGVLTTRENLMPQISHFEHPQLPSA